MLNVFHPETFVKRQDEKTISAKRAATLQEIPEVSDRFVFIETNAKYDITRRIVKAPQQPGGPPIFPSTIPSRTDLHSVSDDDHSALHKSGKLLRIWSAQVSLNGCIMDSKPRGFANGV